MIERAAAHRPLPRPISFRLLLDLPLRWMRRELRTIYPAVAVPVALLQLLTLVPQRWLATPGASPSDPFAVLGQTLLQLLAMLPIYLAIGVAYAAMDVACVDAVAGREVSISRAWRFILRPRALATLLLAALAMLAAALFCLLPVLYVAPLLGFTVAVMADEGSFGLAALRRSAALARHNPSRRLRASPLVKVLALHVVGALLSFGGSALVLVPLAAVQTVLTLRKMATGGDPQDVVRSLFWLQIPAVLVSSLISTAVRMYKGFGLAELFFDTRRRREAPELREAILAMTAGLQP